MKLHRTLRGVTLMELLIVVVIIGILAAIGYPNYRQFVARAKRTEAKALLLEIAQNQERHYLQNNTYGNLTDLGYGANTITTDSESYDVTVNSADSNNFTVTATYNFSDEEASKCNTFTIDGGGSKTSAPLANCWTRAR